MTGGNLDTRLRRTDDPRCALCTHTERRAIERHIARGTDRAYLVQRYNLPDEKAIARHVDLHAGTTIARIMERQDRKVANELDGLLGRMVLFLDRLEDEEADPIDKKQRVGMIREYRSTLEMVARMSGEMPTRTIQALLNKYGLKNEDDLARLVEERNALTALTVADLENDCCASLEFVFTQDGLARERVQRRLFPPALNSPPGNLSSAEVVEESEAKEGGVASDYPSAPAAMTPPPASEPGAGASHPVTDDIGAAPPHPGNLQEALSGLRAAVEREFAPDPS